MLRDLAAPHADLAKPSTLATIGLNFSVSNALATLQKLITAMSERNYQCKTYAQAASALNAIAPHLTNPLITGLTNSLTGVNIAIHDVNASANNISLTDGAVVVSGKDIPSVLSKGQKLLVFDQPKLAMMKFDKGAFTAVDLNSLLGIPLKVNATLTDDDFIVATEVNDVKAIADLPKATDGRIISVMVNGNIGKILNAVGVGFIQLPEGSMTTLSFGVTAAGVEMSADMKFDNK